MTKNGTVIAGRGDTVLIGTKGGVLVASFTGTALALSPTTALCAPPRSLTALGDGTWAVMTRCGLTTIATLPGHAPSVIAQTTLNVVNGATTVQLMSGGCQDDDDDDDGGEHGIGKHPSIVMYDQSRAFVVLEKAIAEVDLSNPEAPAGGRGLDLPHRIDALRLATLEGRAYGAGEHRFPIIDLRGPTLELRGPHALKSWVRRSDGAHPDGTRVSARIAQHHVEVAWVIP